MGSSLVTLKERYVISHLKMLPKVTEILDVSAEELKSLQCLQITVKL